ncbi:MAG: peptidase, partial [Caldanaerobacter sp.]
MKSSKEYLTRLVQFGHRGSATKNEKEAAEYIKKELEDIGYQTEIHSFKTTRDNLYMLPLQVGVLLLIAGLLSLLYGNIMNAIAFFLSIFGVMILLMEISGVPVETSIMPRFLSQNVFTKFDDTKEKKIIVSAHYDTQKASIMFHPKVVDYLGLIYNISYFGFALVPLGIVFNVLKMYFLGNILLKIGLLIVIANIIFMTICEITGKYTQGANDNGTGVSLALALAEY